MKFPVLATARPHALSARLARVGGGLALALAAALAGCSSTNLNGPAPVENRDLGAAGANAGGAGANGAAASTVTPVDLTAGQGDAGASANVPRVIYFDFDSFVIKDEYNPVIEANARLLKSDPKRHMVVEGHTDERGGSEYNLALGQKRAEAVVKALEVLGASDSQLEAVSFGKERPAVQGHDEAAWAKNRRAEIRDR